MTDGSDNGNDDQATVITIKPVMVKLPPAPTLQFISAECPQVFVYCRTKFANTHVMVIYCFKSFID